ncbi:MAG: adenylate/guanylate cyclase domain-containing protein [Pseudomonadota bacterium]
MKKHIVRFGLSLAVVLVFLLQATKSFELPLIRRLDSIFYDMQILLTMPGGVDPRIVIVDLDEKSLAEREKGGEGRWPWPRDRLALLLDKLFDHYQIAIIGFDVVFAERDESSGINVLQKLARKELRGVSQFQSALRQLQPQLNYDAIFANSMRNRAVVLGYAFTQDSKAPIGQLPSPVFPAGTFAGKQVNFLRFPGHTANLPELQKAAASAGHFAIEPDGDGINRRVPMLIESNGAYYESLSLAIVRKMIGSPAIVPGYGESEITATDNPGLEWLKVGSLRIPVDSDGVTSLIPYRGGEHSFKYVPAVDVMNARVDVADLKGKIVLVGTTAPGLLDLRATPVGGIYPGVEVHANMIGGILDGTIKQSPAYVIALEFTVLLLAGLIMALLLPLLTPLKSLLVTVVVASGAVAGNSLLFYYGNLVLPLASGLTMIALLFAFNMTYGYFVETRGKRQITGLFGQYVPPELVDEMAKNPEHFSMEGESREMSVLFSDVRGFTTISEGLDPKQLSQLMNEFLTPLTEVIYQHRGTIDKYMGDCIMAFWGAPLPDPGHARNGLLAGLEMHAALEKMTPEFRARGWPEIRIGVGVNSGRMSVGNMGSRIRLAYTVMGDAVNLASRLESITKQYGVNMIVGEDTRNAVSDAVFCELDLVRVKGKDTAVKIFEPLGLQGQVEQAKLDEAERYAEFLRLYRGQAWDQAEQALLNLQKMALGNYHAYLYEMYVKRIPYKRENPPGMDWDGAWTWETK